MNDRPICGTARLAMDKYGALSAFRCGHRAAARRELAVAAERLREATARWTEDWDTPRRWVVEAVLATVLSAQGDHAAAQRMFDGAMVVRKSLPVAPEERLKPPAPDMWTARASCRRADELAALGDFAAAEESYREGIAVIGRLWGDGHLETASYKDDLATLLLRVGRAEEAEALIREARASSEAAGFRYTTE